MTEEYRVYEKDIEVSNLGNVRKGGKPMIQHRDKYYYYVLIGSRPVRVHNMVGECFPEICGEKILFGHYHHLNHNQLDNRAENIRCITNSEHQKIHRVEDGAAVPVKAYDKCGKFVGRWDSKTQAAEATGADYRHISECINGQRKTSGGLVWVVEWATEDEVMEIVKPYLEKYKMILSKQEARNKFKIVQVDRDGNEVSKWKSVKDIAEHYKINPTKIYSNLNGKTEYVKSITPVSAFVYI